MHYGSGQSRLLVVGERESEYYPFFHYLALFLLHTGHSFWKCSNYLLSLWPSAVKWCCRGFPTRMPTQDKLCEASALSFSFIGGVLTLSNVCMYICMCVRVAGGLVAKALELNTLWLWVQVLLGGSLFCNFTIHHQHTFYLFSLFHLLLPFSLLCFLFPWQTYFISIRFVCKYEEHLWIRQAPCLDLTCTHSLSSASIRDLCYGNYLLQYTVIMKIPIYFGVVYLKIVSCTIIH